MIQLQSPAVAESVLSPKAKGVLILDAVLKDARLDFLLLCSSLSAIEGPLGQVDYCSANAFLDAFAQQSSSGNGKLVVSVNWDAWQEIGMAVNTVVPRELEKEREESLKLGLLPDEGVEVFARILQTSLRQVLVSTSDLQASLENSKADTEPDSTDSFDEDELLESAHARPVLGTAYVATRSEVEQNIAAIWQKLLGVAQVGVFDNFFELGGHSLLAVQLISRLRDQFQVEVTVHDLFNAPTVAELAERIEGTGTTAQEDLKEIDQMLQLVEQLSEDELRQLLSK
jgi:acyl carrier protein